MSTKTPTEKLQESVDTLAKGTEKVLGRIDSMEEHWSKTIGDVQREVTELKEKGLQPDEERLKQTLVAALGEMDKERVNQGTIFGEPHEDKSMLPDTWRAGHDGYGFGDTDPAFLVRKGISETVEYGDEKLTGLDALVFLPPATEHLKRFQQISDDIVLADTMLRITTPQGKTYPGHLKALPKMSRQWGRALNGVLNAYGASEEVKAAVFGDVKQLESSSNPNWIPTGFSNQLRELIKVRLTVAALFQRFPMPTDPYKLPIDLTDTLGDLIAEGSGTDPYADTDLQTLVDINQTFDASKLRGRMLTSAELTEDAIIAMLPLMRQRIVQILGNSLESAILNGDDTATHMDFDITGAKDVRKAFKGLRAYCQLGDGTNPYSLDVGAITASDFLDVRAKMLEFGVDPDRLVYIVTINTYLKMIGDTTVLTVDKYGANATVLRGELARLYGIPVIVSRYQRADVAATGVNTTGGPNTLSSFLCVNRDGFLIGDRRDITLESERWINSDQWNVVAFQRVDFKGIQGAIGTTAARKICYQGINVTN